jgi:hypothetical protein
MEDELRDLGSHPKQRDHIERREELEVNIDLMTKNIQNLRLKLKEITI